MNNRFAFLPMRASNGLLEDPDALRARLDEDSYLLFRRVIDRDKVLALRAEVVEVLARLGWTDQAGRAIAKPLREEDDEFRAGYQEIQKLESFHALAHDEGLLTVMRAALGPSAFPHPLKIARIAFPDHYEATTPPHQDFPNNQGTPALTASWIPLGPVRDELGGLAVLRGSARHGLLPLAGHVGAGNRQAVVPDEMSRKLRWVTTDFGVGDVLLFPSLAVHAALHNSSTFYPRLSVDFRYQLEGEALTEGCLEPHFRQLSWEQVYEGWSSDELQYYWRDLDYEVVPFETIPIVDEGEGFDQDDLATIVKYRTRVDARHERRMAALADAPDA